MVNRKVVSQHHYRRLWKVAERALKPKDNSKSKVQERVTEVLLACYHLDS